MMMVIVFWVAVIVYNSSNTEENNPTDIQCKKVVNLFIYKKEDDVCE